MKAKLFFVAIVLFATVLRSQPTMAWAGRMGGPSNDNIRGMTIDPSGNIIMTGSFKGTVDFDITPNLSYLTSSSSSFDVYFSKYNPTGGLIWACQLSGVDHDAGFSVRADISGNIFATGFFTNTVDFDPGPGIYNLTGSANGGIFILKLDPSGNFLWAKQISGYWLSVGTLMALDMSGNINIVGQFQGVVDFDPGPGTYTLSGIGQDHFVAKYDPVGNFLWADQLSGNLVINSMSTDVAGNVYTTGYYKSSVDFDPGPTSYALVGSSGGNTYIWKLDASGNFAWVEEFTGNNSGESIKIDNLGNIYLTGAFGTPTYTDFDPGPGTYNLLYTNNLWDAYVAKLNSVGNLVWVKQLVSKGSETGYEIDVDALGNVYTTGVYRDTIDLDPGPATYTFTQLSGAYPDIYISKLDMNGNFMYGAVVQSFGLEMSKSMVVNPSGDLYVTGIFSYPCDFDPGPSNTILTPIGGYDVFLMKLYDPSVGIISSDFPKKTVLKVYPNPFNTKIIVETETDNAAFTIYNALGSAIRSGIITDLKTEIDLSNEPEGVYFIKTDAGTCRIIKY